MDSVMDYDDFLATVLGEERELLEVRTRRASPPLSIAYVQGTKAGLDACAGKGPKGLDELMKAVERTLDVCDARRDPELPFWRAKFVAVETVCNCVSAYLSMVKQPVIFQPTPVAVAIAERIALGVGKKTDDTTGTVR